MAIGPKKPMAVEPEAIPKFFAESKSPEVPGPKEPAPQLDLSAVRAIEGPPAALLTHAGTVTASMLELRYKSVVLKRFWMSEAIPLWRLAKMEVPALKAVMEVRDFGINARSLMALPGPDERKVTVQALEEIERQDDGYAEPLPDGGVRGDTGSAFDP